MNGDTPPLGAILESFFSDYLKLQRGLRPNSIKSYADAWRLFLQFAAEASGKKVTQLGLNDLHADAVSDFLASLEDRRHNAPQSRNQRLAAIRTFFNYVGRRFPDRLGQAQRVTTIPRKRAQSAETVFLERDEIERTLARLPAPSGLRDRTLLLFLYNTGARVQEAAGLRVNDIHLDPNPRAHLHGKGDKWRVCPLWTETAVLLQQLLSKHAGGAVPDRPVFTNSRGIALTRFGIYKIVRRYTADIVKRGSDGQPRRVSPHTWRHSTAVHLLEAGVEVNVIRAWLGHASLEITNRYAEITLRMKQAALEKCSAPEVREERIPRTPKWQSDTALLHWLQSL
ncbi:MAG TPA: tyrosine-type recombinase/integrase [Terracidiphilus sp.]|nr:tyrosine-type recombinase/integrase [Terracidiphilus sp.]